MPALVALEIADPPERWRALGFDVDGEGRVRLRGVELRLGASGRGITAWALAGGPALELVPCVSPPGTPVDAAAHPNTAVELDHVVITVPDFDATAEGLEAAGLPFRRVRQATPEIRQGFRRLGPAIMEVVEAPGAERAGFWGLTITVTDLAALPREHVSEARPAVQPGRRIATVARAAGLSTRLAFMDPDEN